MFYLQVPLRFDFPILFFESQDEWRTWLEQNHNAARGVWLKNSHHEEQRASGQKEILSI
jgi:uncharacterized protein YdeI (YjbR/CyaY-like superfamily)